MKSMQRRFGGLMKRTDDEQDVGTVLADFKAVDAMLDSLLRELKTWRNGWEDILKLQYDCADAFTYLYKPIEPTNDPEMQHQPAQTPQKFLQKCLALQKAYASTKADLAQEISMIDKKLMRPMEQAQQAIKPLKKTVKHRENAKLDYERYKSRADHAGRKETRSAKEEAALATHESNLAQAQIDYQTADEQVKQTFPPVTAAVRSLLPYMLTNQIMLQTTLVGQLYTVLDAYCKQQGFPSPAPGDAEIIAAWDREFTGFRKEVESGLNTIARGKAVNLAMTLPPEKDTSTVTGFGLRNRAMGLRKSSNQAPPKPATSSASVSTPSTPAIGWKDEKSSTPPTPQIGWNDNKQPDYEEEEEAAPPKPPRPGQGRIPSFNPDSKPRIPSYSNNNNIPSASPPPYEAKPTTSYPASPSPWADQVSSNGGGITPGRIQSPFMNGGGSNGTFSPNPQKAPHDYFSANRASSNSSMTSSIAAKKKPPPPVPTKRITSGLQASYVTALFDFEGQNAGDLAFAEGDRIRVVRKTESTDDWWEGELRGVQGSFPANYVRLG
ncbi:hypothetical protein MBLNU230_g8077t1 [Neophaeotheca triangularis]